MIKRINSENGNTQTMPKEVVSSSEGRKKMLSAISKSGGDQPNRIVMFASEGFGKTSFAADLDDPIFIPTEDGMRSVVADCFPVPTKWQEIIDDVETLRLEDHAYKTLVIDTADSAERLCQEYILERDNKKSVEDYGYGRGFVIAHECYKNLVVKLDALRKEKNMNICFLAHAAIKTFNNPMSDNYDRWELKLDRRIAALLKEWSDILLFGNYDVAVDVKTGQTRGKGYGGDRILCTSHQPSFDAKNRHGLPEKISIPLVNPALEFKNLLKGVK